MTYNNRWLKNTECGSDTGFDNPDVPEEHKITAIAFSGSSILGELNIKK